MYLRPATSLMVGPLKGWHWWPGMAYPYVFPSWQKSRVPQWSMPGEQEAPEAQLNRPAG